MENNINIKPTFRSDAPSNNLDSKVEQYVDTEGISTKKLSFGLWYIEHRALLRWLVIIFLSVISGITWAYSIYGAALYWTRGRYADEQLMRDLTQSGTIDHSQIVRTAPKNLVYFPAQILPAADNKYDLLAEISNINEQFWGEIEYYFLIDDRATDLKTDFIFPGDTKYLLALGQEANGRPANVQLIIKQTSWNRINRRAIKSWADYYQERANFANTDIKYIPANLSILSDKLNLNQLSFNTTNNTAQNYWEVSFLVFLYERDTITGVNKLIVDKFMSGQKRLVEASWPGNFGQVDRVDIKPEVNFMDPHVYIKMKGGVGQEK